MIKQNVAGMLSLVDENYVSEADPTQSKPKQKLSWQKLTAIAASICVFISVLAISILIPTMNSDVPPDSGRDTGLAWGFQVADGNEIPTEWCAYKTAKIKYDIGENIEITFYFGSMFNEDINQDLEGRINIPEFDVYFGDAADKQLHLIRHSTENFVSEEYRITPVFDENWYIKKLIYNHSETVTIPQELLTEQQGVIRFYVAGINVNEYDPEYDPDLVPEYKIITCVLINYDIKDGKVVLSKWDGKRK